MVNVKNILSQLREFPTLPTIYGLLSDTMANPRSSAVDVAEVISQDQASASKVLKAANSSIYGIRGRVSTITQAIVYLGFDEVKHLILAMAIIKIFGKQKTGYSFNVVDLWKHSLAVGVITRLLGKSIGVKKLEDYFIAGILHDIGKLAFLKIAPEEYNKVVDYAIENNLSAKEAESEILEITHTVAGETLAEMWKLPVSIKDGIRYHISGRVEGKLSLLVSCIHVADIVASMLELGHAGDAVIPKPNMEVWDALKLPDNYFTTFMPKILMDYEESVQLMLVS